ncbi:MAG: hypothetical protein ACOYOV_15960 [Bacteroidales bacterium]
MKKITLLFITIIAIFFVSCAKSPEDKAKAAIKEYLQKHLNDAKSYESVEFGKLINDSTEYEDSYNAKILMKQHIYALEAYNKDLDNGLEDRDNAKVYLEQANIDKAEADRLEKKIEKDKKEFKRELCYIISHKYRAKNKLGALILQTSFFTLSEKFEIIDELSEN